MIGKIREMTHEKQEVATKTGRIVVITGRRGSGKDFVIEKLFEHQTIMEFELKRLVTHANYEERGIRDGEVDGVHYHFRLLPEMQKMVDNGEFVEELMPTGVNSFKATSKKEVMRVLSGENLLWRIEMKRAAEVAKKDFFQRVFPPDTAEILNKSARVILIDVEEDEITRRRILRGNYNPADFVAIDKEEKMVLEQDGHHFKHRVKNPIGGIEQTIKEILAIIQS